MPIPRKDSLHREARAAGEQWPARGFHLEKQVEGSALALADITPAGIGAAAAKHGHLKHNLSATSDPTATDDVDSGYSSGSIWINISTPAIFVCVTATVGAADWNQIDAAVAAGAHGPGEHTEFANWKLLYTDGSGDQQELALGAAGTYVRCAGVAAAPTVTTIPGGDVPDGADSTAIHDNESGEITAIAEKATPVANDEIVIEDSAASDAKKSVKISNLKTPLKAVLFSVHQYVFTPDAAPGADVATGAHQGNIYVSGPATETVKRITVICETAAGTAFTFTLDYDSGNDDFDSFTVDTEIDEVAVGTAKGVIVSAGFTNGTIAAQSLISLDIPTITGSAPKDVTIILEVWRPLQT
jgi:hypothetical protein